MNEVWNLDGLYRGFDDPAFDADLQKLKDGIAEFAKFTAQLPGMDPLTGLRQGIEKQEQLRDLGSNLAEYAMLRQSADTVDPAIGSKVGLVMAALSDTAAPEAAFQAWASGLENLTELVESDELLREYRFLFENMKKSSRYLLAGRGEEIMAKMSLSGGSAWSELQQYLTSTVPVIYRGETTNLSAIRNLAYDGDAAVRKDAYEAELACYDRIKDAVAYALNSIKLETVNDCALRGYESPLERTLKDSNMERATLDAMLGAMVEFMPKFRQYLRAKGRALGHENGLPWYDIFAPMGAMNSVWSVERTRDYLVELFAGFDSELSEMVARAFDEAWIDFYPRSGKSGGAFCAGVEKLHESRILTNFDSQFTDVVTLAHELGHAFHNQCIDSHRPLNRDYSMPLAETASTFNECVIMNAAIKAAKDPAERLALIENQLQDTCQVIVDIYSRYRFESMVFERRPDEFMNAEELCRIMDKAQEESYGDGLDPELRHSYMWLCKSHYYGPIFYNFPYAFGALFARGLYACYEREGAAFVPKYKKLLYTTPIASAEDTAKVAGIDLTDREFWRAALQGIADEIDEFCTLVQ
ncbi:MAG: M3 family oligoendopeptidase [Oscillospiraceae bacterium]|nr:M3 family oligoendopeptidase [Oscillospiraceae bacterium]